MEIACELISDSDFYTYKVNTVLDEFDFDKNISIPPIIIGQISGAKKEVNLLSVGDTVSIIGLININNTGNKQQNDSGNIFLVTIFINI